MHTQTAISRQLTRNTFNIYIKNDDNNNKKVSVQNIFLYKEREKKKRQPQQQQQQYANACYKMSQGNGCWFFACASARLNDKTEWKHQ